MPLLPPTGLTVTPTSAPPWALRFGGTGAEGGVGVALDSDGNIVFTGSFQGAVDFGGGSLTSAGGYDLVIAKYSAAGVHQWSKRFGGAGDESGGRIAIDASGNIFYASVFQGTAEFGGAPLTSAGARDIVVAKYSPTGVHEWSKRFGYSREDYAWDIAVDSNGDVVVTGSFSGPVDFGGGEIWSAVGGRDTFVLKLSSAGGHIWSKNFPSHADDEGRSVAIDAEDNILIAGYTSAAMDFGGGYLTPTSTDGFLVKLSSSGAHVWSKLVGGSLGDQALGVAVDGSGNVFLTGVFLGTINLGGSDLVSGGYGDTFLAKYSSGGAHIWSKAFRGPDEERPFAIAVDSVGNSVVIGQFIGSINIAGTVLQSLAYGRGTTFIAKFSPAGNHIVSTSFGGTGNIVSSGVVVDASGHAIITGFFQGVANFGGQSLTSAGDSDIFLCRICRMGNSITWSPPVDQLAGNLIPITTWPDASIEGFYPVELIAGKMYKYVGGANEVDFEYNGVTIDGGDTVEFIADGAAAKIYYTPLAAVTATIKEHHDQTYRLYRNRDIIREIPGSTLSANLPVLDTLLTELTFYTYRVDAIDTGGGIASSPLAAAITPECTPTGYPIQFGGVTGDRPNAATIDASGNVYVCGGLPGMLSPMLFVAKLNSSAAFVWVKYYPSSGSSMITSIAVDASGNVYIAGHFNGSLNLGDGPIQGNSYGFSSFMAKLNSSGVLQFKVAKVDEQGSNSRIAVSSGNIIVASTYVDLGGYYGTRGKVDKYNSSGVLQWSTILGVEDNSATNFACNGLAVDSSGDIHLVGRKVEGVKTICGQTMDSGPASNTLLTKLSGSDGSCVWVRNHGLSELRGSTTGLAIALDSQGNHLVTGFYTINGSAGGERFPEAINFPSPFIAKYDSSGNHIWSQGIKTLRFAAPSRILVGDNDAAFVIGTADPGRFIFPSHDVAVPVPSGYVMKFSSAGVFASLNFYGNDLADAAIAPSSKIMLAGGMETPTKGLDNFIELLTQ